MKITNLELVNSTEGLNMVAGLHLPVKTSFALGKLMRVAAASGQDYETARNKLIEKHAKKDEAGKFLELKDGAGKVIGTQLEDKDAFESEIKELQAIEIELPGEQIRLEDLGNVNLPAKALAHLHWLFKE